MMLRTLFVAGIIVWSFAAHAAPLEITLHQREQGYFNSGTITLRDPFTNSVLGRYEFLTGGCGRGAAPFGTYEVGEYQGPDDDPLHIGPRWLIRHKGMADGEAQDPRYTIRRTELELHSLHEGRWRCTLGCMGIDGGRAVYEQFMEHLRYLLWTVDHLEFTLAGNPDAPVTETVVALAPERLAKVHHVHRRGSRARHHRRHR